MTIMFQRSTAGVVAHECLAEAIGTYILVFFGVGVVQASVLTGVQTGIWQVAIVWGIAIGLAIYATGAISGAHINPAITLAFVTYRKFPAWKAPWYIGAQFIGAFLAAATLHLLFGHLIHEFESSLGLIRGKAGSELSAMVYGEYFPNPSVLKTLPWTSNGITLFQAMLAEGLGTAFLGFFVFALTDQQNPNAPRTTVTPILIGLVVSIAISVIAPLTQAGFNPARDFGPRLFAYFAGWGFIAIPGPHGGFFMVYILSPILGALLGAGGYQYSIGTRWAGSHSIRENHLV